jgi:glycerol-3-phosphate cytidylyltransferase
MSAKVGYTPGAFDLFHDGHLNILRHAKSRCDYLIAGVLSDDVLELMTGRPAVVPLDQRMEIVRNIGFVDMVFAEVVPDRMQIWQELRFNLLFKGNDWRGTAAGKGLEEAFAAVGVEVAYFPFTHHASSTALRAALELVRGHIRDESFAVGGRL